MVVDMKGTVVYASENITEQLGPQLVGGCTGGRHHDVGIPGQLCAVVEWIVAPNVIIAQGAYCRYSPARLRGECKILGLPPTTTWTGGRTFTSPSGTGLLYHVYHVSGSLLSGTSYLVPCLP